MLIDLPRARALISEAGLDAVVLATLPNITYSSDVASEYMLGTFEDYTHAVVLPAREDVAPALVVPDNDLPHMAESPSWIDDIYSYGNPWSSIGQFIGRTLEDHLGTPFRERLQALRRRTSQRQVGTMLEALTAALARPRPATRAHRLRRHADRADARGARDRRSRRHSSRSPTDAHRPCGEDRGGGRLLGRAAEDQCRGADAGGASGPRPACGKPTSFARGEPRSPSSMHTTWASAACCSAPGMRRPSICHPTSGERCGPGEAVVLDCIGSYKRCSWTSRAPPWSVSERRNNGLRHHAVATSHCGGDERDASRRAYRKDRRADLQHARRVRAARRHHVDADARHRPRGVQFPVRRRPPERLHAGRGMVVDFGSVLSRHQLGGFHMEDTVVVTHNGARVLADLSRELYRI